MKQKWILFSGVLLIMAGLVMTGCGGGGSDDIGWSATADGSADAASTKITFAFDKEVTGLAAGDITITNGTGEAAKGALTGSGKAWVLAISGVKSGTVSVSIAKGGIKTATATVTVFGGTTPPLPPPPPTKWTRSLQPFRFKLADNFQYGKGYQGVLQNSFLFHGDQIKSGDTYTLKVTFTASRNFEQKMTVGLVDTTSAAEYWAPLTWTGEADMTTDTAFTSILADTPVSVTLQFTAIRDATSDVLAANAIVFATEGAGTEGTAGSGVQGKIYLRFSEFTLTKGEGDAEVIEPAGTPTPFDLNIVESLGASPTENNGDTQQGWKISSLMEEITDSQYLVIATKGGDSNDGFGGIAVIYQGNDAPTTPTIDVGWTEVKPVDESSSGADDAWLSYTRAADKTVYIVLDLHEVFGTDYDDIVQCTNWARLLIGYYGGANTFAGLGIQNAYLVDSGFTKPVSGTVDLHHDLGFIFE